MNPVGKALWYIESHFAGEVTLDELASVAGVSRYYMSRAFGMATGRSTINYLRGRRLSEAARLLASGAPDILTVAIEVGYGSHEAFTRAFRDQFGVTPETVRSQGHRNNIKLVEAIKMDESLLNDLESPRFENGKALLIAGLSERCNDESSANIPAQWQRFNAYIGNIRGQIGAVDYGVCCNSDDNGNIDYVSGVEVADFSWLPVELVGVRIPAQKYAVFFHRDHIATIRRTWHTIFSKWLPESQYQIVDAPNFERYDEQFDPRAGTGGVEIWIPIAV